MCLFSLHSGCFCYNSILVCQTGRHCMGSLGSRVRQRPSLYGFAGLLCVRQRPLLYGFTTAHVFLNVVCSVSLGKPSSQ